jgi:hypothetical protein
MKLLTVGLLIGFYSIVINITVSLAQNLSPDWKKTVVLIEEHKGANYQPVATGFIVIFQEIPFLITNKHVAENNNLVFRFNSSSSSTTIIRLSVDSILAYLKIPWAFSKTADLAAIPISFYPSMVKYQDSIVTKSLGISLFKNWDYLNEGDAIFVLGFPIGLGAGSHYSAVYRSGIIALKEQRGSYLIDSKIFPGNSGGPVFMKPEIYDYRTKSLGKGTVGYFVGVVSAYIPYTDIAVSMQTKRPRITFEENSGLAIVYSSENVVDLLSSYIKQYNIK